MPGDDTATADTSSSGTADTSSRGVAPIAVAALLHDARTANSAGRPAAAERLLRSALESLEGADPQAPTDYPSVAGGDASAAEATVRARLTLSGALLERAGPARALRTAHRALADAEKMDPTGLGGLVAISHSQLAMLHGRAGRTTAALAELDKAVRGLDALTARERFVILLNRGMLRLDVVDIHGAAADFAAAADLAAEAGLAREEFKARHNLGHAAALEGDLPRALSLMLKAENLPVDVSRAVAWHGRAVVLLDAGLVGEAVDLLERAIGEATADGQRYMAGLAQVDLARAHLLLGDVAAAHDTARAAERSLGRQEASGHRRRAELVKLQARLREGTGDAAIARRGASLAQEFAEEGDVVAADQARLVAAEAQTRRGRHADALELLDRSSDLARIGSISTRMRTRAVIASAALADEDRPTARRHVRAALRDLIGAVGASSSLELRAATQVQGTQLAHLDLALAGDRPAQRLAAAERWRAAAGHLPPVRPPADPELARRLTALRHLRQQIRDEPALAAENRERLRTLERQVAGASWSMPGTDGARPRPAPRVAHVREVLRHAGATVVYLVDDGERLGAVVVSPGRTRCVDLGPLDGAVEAARRLAADAEARSRVAGGPMAAAVERALVASSRHLDAMVLRPLDVDGRLVVVPVHGLAGVPWGLLPSRAGQPTTVAPSLGSWLRAVRPAARPQVTVLAGPGLPGALEECAQVAPVWRAAAPASLAGADDLVAALGGSDLVHVAAHGTHRSDSPLFSSVWLEDGPTFLCDLERLTTVPSHVVISACDTGRSGSRSATGGSTALGLASGLLSLGVGCVVASPCRVPDATAGDVMPRYHRLLATGVPADEALARAAEASDLPLPGAFVTWGSPWSVGAPVA